MSTLGNTSVSPEKARTAGGGHHTASAGNMSENLGADQSRESCENTVQNLNQSEYREKSPGQPRKRKSISGSPISSTRLLRSKSKEKSGASEAKNTVVTHDATEEKKRKRRKKKHSKHIAANEFTRIRGHLRYLLQRIKYEQTLIEAYSGEGWKGQSLEKIKLEKELQRAKTHIFRYKLKIRDLFQRLDTLLAEGRLPASLFDNEGEIDSEDIFCAKCGSMDLPADNDIILCDGACERGFHQLCVEPPLLKEDIPPDDEGWLCPGCDCKVDCIDLLNDLQGTDLSVTDSWEKVYPKEAAAAASGEKLDDISGLPSDDSEDDDYNPETPDVGKNDSEDESSSDESESDFYSASEDLAEAPTKDDEILGLSSEDSEDDDFNPDDPDKDEPVKTESSSSDFTSDSEDFSLIVDTNRLRGDEQGVSSSVDNSMPNSASLEEKAKVGKAKGNSLKDELSYLMQSDSPLVSAKRHIERLDYKKLHDETYGNGSSDSSDEDYDDGPLPKVRKLRNAKGAMASPSSTPADIKYQSGKQKGSGHASDSGISEKLKVGGAGTSESPSSGKRKTYGEVSTKRLYESFKDNQYPDRDAKEKLGKELGLTAHQVSKWFENARHCHRHSPNWNKIMSQKVSEESPSKSQIIGEPLGTESNSIIASCNGVEKLEQPKQCLNGEKGHAIDKSEEELLIQDTSGKKSSEPTKKVHTTNQGSEDTPRSKTSKKQKAKVGTANSQNDNTTEQASGGTPCSKTSKKQKARVGTANSQNDNTTDQGPDDTPQSKTRKKPMVKVDTPNSQNVRRSSRLQKQG